MDWRVIAAIFPTIPFVYTGASIAYSLLRAQHLDPYLIGILLSWVAGLAGIAGLVMAALRSTFASSRRARIAICLLFAGLFGAVGGPILLVLGNRGASTAIQVIFIFFLLSAPIAVAVDSIYRLQKAL